MNIPVGLPWILLCGCHKRKIEINVSEKIKLSETPGDKDNVWIRVSVCGEGKDEQPRVDKYLCNSELIGWGEIIRCTCYPFQNHHEAKNISTILAQWQPERQGDIKMIQRSGWIGEWRAMVIAIFLRLKKIKLFEEHKPRKINSQSCIFFTHEVELMGQRQYESQI